MLGTFLACTVPYCRFFSKIFVYIVATVNSGFKIMFTELSFPPDVTAG